MPASNGALGEVFAIAAMGASGLAMLTKQPIWCWVGLWLSIASLRVAKPHKAEDSPSAFSGWSSLLFSLTAITSVYLPLFTGMATKAPLSFSTLIKMNSGLILSAPPPPK